LPDDQQHHDHQHHIDNLAADPLHRRVSFGLAALNAMLALAGLGLNTTTGSIPELLVEPGSKFTLSAPFAPLAGFRC
jgi:hypothetical protein